MGVIKLKRDIVADAINGKGNGLKMVVFADGWRREEGSQPLGRLP